jgi:hypothetical protein
MTPIRPSRAALALLEWATGRNQALIGDVLEEYQVRRSRVWLWKQVLLAVIVRPSYTRPEGAVDDGSVFKLNPVAHPANSPIARRIALEPLRINVSSIQAQGIGGLGLLWVILVMTLVMPAAWWLAVCGLAGGLVLGTVLVMKHRRHGLSDGKGNGPGEMFNLHMNKSRRHAA